MRYALLAGIRVVLRQFSGTASLYGLFLLSSGVLNVLYLVVSSWLGANAVLAIACLILLQQIYIWLRASLRVGLFAGERELLRHMRAH